MPSGQAAAKCRIEPSRDIAMPFDLAGHPALEAIEVEAALAASRHPAAPPATASGAGLVLDAVQVPGDFDHGIDAAELLPCAITLILSPGHPR
jgi:hypothetical protein